VNFFDYIRDWFIWATQVLVVAAINAYSWPLVGSWFGDTFNNLSTFTARVGGYLWDASNWYNDVSAKISNSLSWATIWSYILSYFPRLLELRDWFDWWVKYVEDLIWFWWRYVQEDVKGWISAALQPFNAVVSAWNSFWGSLWPQLVSSFNSLKSSWDNFWTVTLPSLVSLSWLATWWDSKLLDVQALIDSSVKEWFPFYDDLVNLWGGIAEFFTNPVEYIWKRFTNWFFGVR